MCNYQISLSPRATPSDILTLTIQFIGNAKATLIKGPSLQNATNKYTVGAGQTYTIKYGQNFYLNIVGTSSTQVNYVFVIDSTATMSAAVQQPTTVTNVPVNSPIPLPSSSATTTTTNTTPTTTSSQPTTSNSNPTPSTATVPVTPSN